MRSYTWICDQLKSHSDFGQIALNYQQHSSVWCCTSAPTFTTRKCLVYFDLQDFFIYLVYHSESIGQLLSILWIHYSGAMFQNVCISCLSQNVGIIYYSPLHLNLVNSNILPQFIVCCSLQNVDNQLLSKVELSCFAVDSSGHVGNGRGFMALVYFR